MAAVSRPSYAGLSVTLIGIGGAALLANQAWTPAILAAIGGALGLLAGHRSALNFTSLRSLPQESPRSDRP